MSHQLINHSPDLKRLRDEGYEIETKGGYLITHHIPFVNSKSEIKYGKLISTLHQNLNTVLKPDTHVIHFMGDEHPCNKGGQIITAIQHATINQPLFDGLIMNYSFSNKPAAGYDDYYHKITRYVEIISSPAKSINTEVTAKTFKVILDTAEDTVFKYTDTNSSRANILQINSKFKGQRIGIIGLGGTGSYVLDLVAKTQVSEILLFDKDDMLQHNAFRTPGAPSFEVLNLKPKKVDYLGTIYSQMHKFIKPHAVYITEENIHLLKGLSYVFLCIDKNESKIPILSALKQMKIPFFDVGLGINIADNCLVGMLRVTTGTSDKDDHLSKRISTHDNVANEYSTNIQIADLNLLNAGLAVFKWKKMSGFYHDAKEEHNTTFTINTGQIINEDFKFTV
jgi:hypothetical protein